jgi:HSP20 family protein
MTEKTTDITPREGPRTARRDLPSARSPFRMIEQFADEMDRVFGDFGVSRFGWTPRLGRRGWNSAFGGGTEMWAPDIEVYQRENELVVRADLPGLKREDVSVDVSDDGITISGERRHEQEKEIGGVYRSERSYGSFCRTVPLPDGAIADQAKATFRNGVLEITVPAPPEHVTRGRRLEITEGAPAKK